MAALGNQVSILLNTESSRSFSNLFEIIFDTSDSQTQYENLTYLVNDVKFEDEFGLELDFNQAIQGFMLKGANRIKGVTITAKETANYYVLDLMLKWMNSIYDFTEHVFIAGVNPSRYFSIYLFDGINSGSIYIEDAIPKRISYPSYSWGESKTIETTISFSIGNAYLNAPKH